MNAMISLVLCTIFFCGGNFPTTMPSNQQKIANTNVTDTNALVLRDTLLSIVTDSLSHDLGKMLHPENNVYKLLKYFRYIGKDTVSITRVWTGDPHYICEYPRETLVSGKIYSMTVCFWFGHPQKYFQKTMGFTLSNGDVISFRFSGSVVPEEKMENDK